MEWIQEIMAWARALLEQRGYGPAALPFAFVLGLASALASACCTLPLLGALVGYSGTRSDRDRRSNYWDALFFMLGTILALAILGSVADFVGQVAQDLMGRYWKIFAGVIAIALGLGALKLLPFKLPAKPVTQTSRPHSFLGAACFGSFMGGGICVASLCCNPCIYIILGVAALQGQALWGTVIMTAYAIGFSLPLTAILLGVSFGTSAVRAQKAEATLRTVGGVLLLVAGFYFLATV